MIEWLRKLAADLDLFTNLTQVGIWGTLGFFFCWQLLRRKKVSLQAKLLKAEKDIQHWKSEFTKKETEAKRLNETLKKASPN